mgnify:CR=1 FL=1
MIIREADRWDGHKNRENLSLTRTVIKPLRTSACTCFHPVITTFDTLDEDVERLSGPHDTFINLQKDYIRLTFDLSGGRAYCAGWRRRIF